MFYFFFVKQKTSYEMRISDWSSDVCSSDLSRIRKQASVEQLRVRHLGSLPQCTQIRVHCKRNEGDAVAFERLRYVDRSTFEVWRIDGCGELPEHLRVRRCEKSEWIGQRFGAIGRATGKQGCCRDSCQHPNRFCPPCDFSTPWLFSPE